MYIFWLLREHLEILVPGLIVMTLYMIIWGMGFINMAKWQILALLQESIVLKVHRNILGNVLSKVFLFRGKFLGLLQDFSYRL